MEDLPYRTFCIRRTKLFFLVRVTLAFEAGPSTTYAVLESEPFTVHGTVVWEEGASIVSSDGWCQDGQCEEGDCGPEEEGLCLGRGRGAPWIDDRAGVIGAHVVVLECLLVFFVFLYINL